MKNMFFEPDEPGGAWGLRGRMMEGCPYEKHVFRAQRADPQDRNPTSTRGRNHLGRAGRAELLHYSQVDPPRWQLIQKALGLKDRRLGQACLL